MTDGEPRRSGRKTKGQHTRNSDANEILSTPTPARATSRRKSAAPKQPTPIVTSPPESTPESARSDEEEEDEDDPNAQIRCPCGANKEVKGDTRMMVQCEGCKVWQHCECLELDEDELDQDKDKLYYCEICKPELHAEFLAKVERGEKPWETIKRNKGRRKRGGRKSSGGKGRGGKGRQTKKRGGKKDDVEHESEPTQENTQEEVHEVSDEPEPEHAVEPTEPEIMIDPALTDEPPPQPDGRADDASAIEAERQTEESIAEAGVVEVTGQEKPAEDTEMKDADDYEQSQQSERQESQAPTSQDERNIPVGQQVRQDVRMENTDDIKDVGETPQLTKYEVVAVSMPPPNVPQAPVQTAVPHNAANKEDQMMADAPERETSITPTTPTVSKHRETKRKGSVTDSTRSIRRKTTHDSDGDYDSDTDLRDKSRRPSASGTTKDAPKEVKVPTRRASVQKPPPKKLSGPDDISIQSELVEKVDDLRNNARRNIVNYLTPIVQGVVAKNPDILTEDQKKEDYPEKLAIEIEHHVYLALWNQHSQATPQYKLKARGIGLNLPKNPLLQSRLLKREVTPEKLVQMKPEEMASEEFQMLAEQVRRESELQNTIVAERTGPRIRRTHKGEEIVEDDINRSGGNDEPVYIAPRGSDHNAMEDVSSPTRSRAVSQATEDYPMSPQQVHTEEPVQPGSTPQTPRTPLTAKTPTARGSQFSIENVWSNINAPDEQVHQRPSSQRPPPPHMLSIRPQQQKLAVDAEIDKLLAEEDHDMENEEPPYSPSELIFSDTLPYWRGHVSMVSVSNFPARAHYLGGAEGAQERIPLGELLGQTMLIDGRIAIDRATEYLCGQKFSHTNEIVVLSIEPEEQHSDPAAAAEFSKLFQYFQRKERYGVVGKPGHKAVKDCYLVPIDLRDDMPDFFETLYKHSLEQAPRKKRVFAVVFVLSKMLLLEDKQNREANQTTDSQSPMTVTSTTPASLPVTQQQQQQQHVPVSGILGYPSQQPIHHQTYSPQQAYVPQTTANHHHAHTHGNGYHQNHPFYHQATTPTHASSQTPPVKRFNFTPWKELQDALPQLTQAQVDLINQVVAKTPAAQHDPALLARLIKEGGGI
ncbi:transcription factor S-II, central domain-containing protein [Kalaharituber pfeilii]|nr:transcription factor S-II, central domain-containing protein [Kalaharituber pfeilii]